ncbi:predicted protein [Naegleria gruberi]|uniref:Predicted protein n=1 Tax=Naegleria gruberi TaxID=5762 RepID=D2W583_NAEGR|nr:uncharacterized protein NAEGRDRAFT_54756 [Naegleria gruberi]EFC35769.1 predicted protein [Naegleria gruberi]|eukprot:XP_002668513.1 predicted protein [Naegleria gruberi strain NEG-M]
MSNACINSDDHTEGHRIKVESRIIDSPTNTFTNSVPSAHQQYDLNNDTRREYSSSSSSLVSSSIQSRGLEGIFSQKNVDTMMNNIIQQILSTLSVQQERMNNIEQKQDHGFASGNTSSMLVPNASTDQHQKIQACTSHVNHQQPETPSSNANQQQLVMDRGSTSSFNNGSGDVGLQGSSSFPSSSHSLSNNTTNSSSSTSTSSSSFNDSKKFMLSPGTNSSTLEFINAHNNPMLASSANQQLHSHNDQLSDAEKPKLSFVVYCASSSKLDEKYFSAATQVGETCAQNGIGVRYGGGNCGLSKFVKLGAHAFKVIQKMIKSFEDHTIHKMFSIAPYYRISNNENGLVMK